MDRDYTGQFMDHEMAVTSAAKARAAGMRQVRVKQHFDYRADGAFYMVHGVKPNGTPFTLQSPTDITWLLHWHARLKGEVLTLNTRFKPRVVSAGTQVRLGTKTGRLKVDGVFSPIITLGEVSSVGAVINDGWLRLPGRPLIRCTIISEELAALEQIFE